MARLVQFRWYLHSAPGSVGVTGANHIHIMVCGTDGAPYVKSSNGTWVDWKRLDGEIGIRH